MNEFGEFEEGVITAVDDLCARHHLPGPAECCWDQQAHWIMEELVEVFDVWDKAEAYGDVDQAHAAWLEVDAVCCSACSAMSTSIPSSTRKKSETKRRWLNTRLTCRP